MDPNEHIDAVNVFKSDHQTETTNPVWVINELKIQQLCNSNENLPLIFEVWSYDNSGSHMFYGSFQTSLSGILNSHTRVYELSDDNGADAGSLEFTQFLIIEKPSMIEYLRSGWMISMSVAIDFTASNGELSDPSSLHYINLMDPTKMNQYEQAIFNVGTILEPYDFDRRFPVFGFGAIPKFMGISSISH